MDSFWDQQVEAFTYPVVGTSESDGEPLIEHLVSGPTPVNTMIRNVGTGKCLNVNRQSDNWMSIQTATCDPASANQIFSLDNGLIRNQAECVTVTYENDTNVVGKQFYDARILPCNEGIGGSIRGHSNTFVTKELGDPFQIQSGKSLDLAFTDSNGTVRNFAVNNNDMNQFWITNDWADKCAQLGIPLQDCSRAGRLKCGVYPMLTEVFESCPREFCVKHPTDQKCINWCKDNANKPGVCDTIYKTYCAANPTEQDLCACINRPPKEPGFEDKGWDQITSNPICFLTKCSSNPNAYKTSDQSKTTACPTIQVCNSKLSLEAGQSVTTGNVALSCVNTNTSTETLTSNDSNTSNSVNTTVNNLASFLSGSSFLWMVVALVIFLVIFLVWAIRRR